MKTLNTTEEIIQDIREGRMVIMTDDETRENEGDIVFAASRTTPESVNFMMKHARGLICVPMTAERIQALGLDQMNPNPEDPMKTAFTVSVDAKTAPHLAVKAFKGRTSRVLRDEFPQLLRMNTLWTRSYFVGSAGNASSTTIRRYIESQWEHGTPKDR